MPKSVAFSPPFQSFAGSNGPSMSRPAMNMRPGTARTTKPSRGSLPTSIPAAALQEFVPTTIDVLPGVGAVTTGTALPNALDKKFVSSSAAKRTTGGALTATTTSTAPGLTSTAPRHPNAHSATATITLSLLFM